VPVDPVNEFARFARDLSVAAANLVGEGELAATIVGRGALSTAERRVPVDKGDLRRSLRLIRRGETSIVEARDEAATFQEYGTSRMAPTPYILPAVEEWGPRLVREVEKIRDRTVRDLG
jgi:hypothetical protein